MLRFPSSVASQQSILAPLIALSQTVPGLESWITLLTKIQAVWPTISPGGLQNIANVGRVTANVCDHLHTSQEQSIYSSQYLLTIAIGARQVSNSASLASTTATGAITLSLTQAAQTALTTLLAWDPVQGYSVPPNPGQLLTTLIEGGSLT